jgi:hypothetical protein
VEPGRLGKEAVREDRQRLSVQVARQGERLPPGFTLVAAPTAMWGEVPEDLLPSWPVPASGKLSIPLDPARSWRLRLVGPNQGTWWWESPAGTRAATLAPAAAADRAITILDGEGQPLSGAGLTVLSGAPGRGKAPVLAQYRSDDRGRIGLRSLPDVEDLTLIVGERRHAPMAQTARAASLPAQIRLEPGASVRGQFVDAKGLPVAGVRLSAEAWISERVPATSRRQAESDAGGRWTIGPLPRGKVALTAQARRFAVLRTQLELAGGDLDLGKVQLQPGLALPLVVVDDAGQPVAAARVTGGPGLEATTDGRGRAVLEGASGAEPIALEAKADGHLPAKTDVAPPFPEPLRIAMRRAFRVTGRFVDPQGVPVSEGTVRVETGNSYRDAALLPGGRFELDLKPSTPAHLALRSALTQELRVGVEAGAPGEIRDLGDLRAPAGVVVHGRIVRGTDGTPVAGARVWTPRPSEQGEVVAWVHRDFVEARSGADGSFQASGLPARPLLLRIDAPGLARRHLPIQPEPDASQIDAGEIALSEGASLTISADAESAAGAVARVDLRNQWLEPDMLTATVVDGKAVVRHVPPGPATVTVLQGRELLCEEALQIAETAGEVEVDCRGASMRVAGTVQVGGRPAGAGLLMWLPQGSATPPALIMNLATPAGLRQQHAFGAGRPQVDVAVDAEGSFATDELRPGAWEVVWVPSAGSLTDPQRVELPRAKEHRLTLSFRGRSLAGVVVDSDERPVEGARVRDLGSDALAFSGADGSFVLAGLAPGAHQLHARLGERTSRIVRAVLEPGREPEPVTLTLDERPEDRIEVLVVGGGGEPAAGAFVFLEEEGRGSRILTADFQGRATAMLQPPYPAQVRAAAVAGGQWALGAWRALEEAKEGLMTLSLGQTGSVLITSQEEQGAPEIRSADGWDLAALLTRIGARPLVAPDLPLEIHGLPEGTYNIGLRDRRSSVVVRGGDRAEIEFRQGAVTE